MWIPRHVRLTGLLLILMLIGLLPANVYSAINRVDFGGHGAGPAYLLVECCSSYSRSGGRISQQNRIGFRGR